MSVELAGVCVAAALAVWALLSARVQHWPLTGPMLFTGLGFVLGGGGLDALPVTLDDALVHDLAEITLVVVLFSDASGVRGHSRADFAVPARLLFVAMVLAIGVGTLTTYVLIPEDTWAMALLTAAILAPTDATLGQAVTTHRAVPERVSRTIGIESGLNDGLALPLVVIAALLAAASSGADAHGLPDDPVRFALLQITLGPAVGAAIGFVAARGFDAAARDGSMGAAARGLFVLAVAGLAFLGAVAIGGNGFVAAFVAGFTFGNAVRSTDRCTEGLVESAGVGLTLATYLVFGAVLVPAGLGHASWRTVGVALAFLSIARILPVWLALLGSPLPARERLFIGWFGPRGLASILFALMVLEEYDLPGAEELVACVVLTVLLSIGLHGVTASPLSRWLGRHVRE